MIYAAENKMEKLIHDPEQEVQVTIEIVNPDIFEAVASKKKKNERKNSYHLLVDGETVKSKTIYSIIL